MATVNTVIFKSNGYSDRNRQAMQVPNSQEEHAEDFTSSATSQASTITADVGEIWEVCALDGNIWVTFGASPTAAVGTTYLIPSGITRHFAATTNGEKIAVIDDS